MESLEMGLRVLRLPSFLSNWRSLATRAQQEGLSHAEFLTLLVEGEIQDRTQRRIERLLRQSQLPAGKTFATLDRGRLPRKVNSQLAALSDGSFLSEAMNVLVFGNPGTGKTHLVSALGYQLVSEGHSVLFTPTYAIVQRLLRAKKELSLERELARLDRIEVLILDDLGYVQQEREEMEVLFTLLSERYERSSVMITSNLVFSQWDRIFKDPLTATAAIDRLVHHSVVIELDVPSYRAEEAERRNKGKKFRNR